MTGRLAISSRFPSVEPSSNDAATPGAAGPGRWPGDYTPTTHMAPEYTHFSRYLAVKYAALQT
jgi:hypothetical protein